MVSAQIIFHTQGPERIQKSTRYMEMQLRTCMIGARVNFPHSPPALLTNTLLGDILLAYNAHISM